MRSPQRTSLESRGATEVRSTLRSLVQIAGTTDLETETVDVRAVAQQAIAEAGGGVPCNLDGIGTARANVEALTRLMVNLVDNAVRHNSNSEPRLDVVVGPGTVVVRDNGGPIPAEHHERIFELGFTSTTTDPGTGVGLALCTTMAEAMGGTISYQPSADGNEFRVQLPT